MITSLGCFHWEVGKACLLQTVLWNKKREQGDVKALYLAKCLNATTPTGGMKQDSGFEVHFPYFLIFGGLKPYCIYREWR